MADVFSKEKRSEIMRKVKSSRNKSTELSLIKFFKEEHITGWRRNYKIKGKPDFVFPRLKITIFCDGCFWHGHNCRNTKPAQNKEYWEKKIDRNKKRDKEINKYLTKLNWKVIRIWECEIKSGEYKTKLIEELNSAQQKI